MKKASFWIAALALFLAPFWVAPTGWSKGFVPLCLKESLVFGLALLGYYWLLSHAVVRASRLLAPEKGPERFGAIMAGGVLVATLYLLAVTKWDWDLRYLWSACQYFR